MHRFYIISIYAVTLTSLIAGGIQGFMERSRQVGLAQRETQTLNSIVQGSITTPSSISVTKRAQRIFSELQSNRKELAFALCRNETLLTGSTPFELSWDDLCRGENNEEVAFSDQRTNNNFIMSSENVVIGKAKFLVVVISNYSSIRDKWLSVFFRTLILTWICGGVAAGLLATQVRKLFKSYFKYLHSPAKSRETERQVESISARRHQEDVKAFRRSLGNRSVVVVANREPYIHQKLADGIEVKRPASGLVTALEPVLREFGGLWIAHGSGNADVETSDKEGELPVPPGQPSYTLKRVWLSEQEELGYYYGFSNEGLWPLCHLAHTRPIFRLSDWQNYQLVNRRFTDAIPERVLNDESVILVQDYHFALLPRMMQQRSGWHYHYKQAANCPKIGLFWHIPWPNPEAFGICPWNKELLHGMLGAHVIGFHTQYLCNNFLETCDRYLEARIDWERFSVTMDNHETLIRSFPIGIDTTPVRFLNDSEIETIKSKYGIKAKTVAIGVDRLDYTKGLLERVEAVARFLEKFPEYVGKFSLVQVGSPSRTHIPSYQLLAADLEKAVNKVNEQFRCPFDPDYKPILFLAAHHDWAEIQYLYQIGDLCMVTSLHDGMNLVAKEYVWCQRPDRGSLILSKFTGASRELTEAEIVNPYSIEEMADAIATTVRMPPFEKAKRMKAMRAKVESRNAFNWASDLVIELTRVKKAS